MSSHESYSAKTPDQWRAWFDTLNDRERAEAIGDLGEQVNCLHEVRMYVLEHPDANIASSLIERLAFGQLTRAGVE